ncbi:hypothetical protein ABID41_000487 [Phenylobacterium koreense]|uniref:Uncharacterized protein n=1 Tax=Phenylobacterium koreense TaxID=266125 RepID=A0ABV2EF40_9CAUL
MEELHRLHKEVPFGWVLWLQQMMARRAHREPAPSRKPARQARLRLG